MSTVPLKVRACRGYLPIGGGAPLWGWKTIKNHLIHFTLVLPCFAQKSQGKRPLLIRRIVNPTSTFGNVPPCLQDTIDDGGKFSAMSPRDLHEGYLVDIKWIETPSVKKAVAALHVLSTFFNNIVKQCHKPPILKIYTTHVWYVFLWIWDGLPQRVNVLTQLANKRTWPLK